MKYFTRYITQPGPLKIGDRFLSEGTIRQCFDEISTVFANLFITEKIKLFICTGSLDNLVLIAEVPNSESWITDNMEFDDKIIKEINNLIWVN